MSSVRCGNCLYQFLIFAFILSYLDFMQLQTFSRSNPSQQSRDVETTPWARRHDVIFAFPLWVFKWTSTFEMWFIPSWTNRFKPHPHTRHLSGLTSSPSNTVACLMTFAGRWTCIAIALSAEIWRFGYSKPYDMSYLIQNIWKTSQVRWKLKIDASLMI